MAVPEIRRLYYSMRDVCGATGLTAHTLKAWERKFPQLKPAQNKSGKRLYKPDDIQLILKIRDLLAGGMQEAEAARILEGDAPPQNTPSVRPDAAGAFPADSELLVQIRRELREMLDLLK
jgi:DNA-binding transcriptional MerR regulator